MSDDDFYANEQSVVIDKDQTLTIELKWSKSLKEIEVARKKR